MRFIPTIHNGSTAERFNESMRPPAHLIPKKLAPLLSERDRILTQRNEAEQHASKLAGADQDEAAKRADDLAAAEAARKGDPIPAPTAVPQLALDRETAERARLAQSTALAEVDNELETVAGVLYFADDSTLAKDVAKTIAEAEATAGSLAEVIEAAVVRIAARDWLRRHYHPHAQISPVDVFPDLARHGLTRENTSPLPVRAVIAAAATAALTD